MSDKIRVTISVPKKDLVPFQQIADRINVPLEKVISQGIGRQGYDPLFLCGLCDLHIDPTEVPCLAVAPADVVETERRVLIFVAKHYAEDLLQGVKHDAALRTASIDFEGASSVVWQEEERSAVLAHAIEKGRMVAEQVNALLQDEDSK